jgi:hypothetical protein
MFNWLHGKIRGHYHAKYHSRYKYPKHLFTFDLFLVAAIVFLAGFILYFNFFWTPAILRQVDLGFYAPADWRIGEETQFEARYANRSKETLGDAVLAIELPRGFILESSSPDIAQYKVLHLGALPAGGNGKVTLRGRAIGNLGEKQELRAYLTFSRGARREQKAAAVAINVSKPALQVDFDFPKVITAGEEIIKEAEILNLAGLTGASLKISVMAPPDFILRGPAESVLEKIENKSSVMFNGYALPKSKEIKIAVLSKLLFENEEFLNDEKIYALAVLPPQISVSLSAGETAYISPGETLSFNLQAVNNSKNAIIGAGFGLADANGMLDREFIPAGARWDGDALIFGARENLSAGKTADLSFRLKIKDDFSKESGELAKNLSLRLAPFVLASKDAKRYCGDFSDLKFVSALALRAFARYFSPEGEPLGRGPLPPKVGKETRAWIFFEIENTTNDILGAKISGHLPPGVEFTGVASVFYGNAIQYDAKNRLIAWDVGLVPAYAGLGAESPAAGFEVKFVPSASDRGKTMILLGGATIAGKDEFAGENLDESAPAVTTAFQYDEEARGMGVVE